MGAKETKKYIIRKEDKRKGKREKEEMTKPNEISWTKHSYLINYVNALSILICIFVQDFKKGSHKDVLYVILYMYAFAMQEAL